MKDEKVFADAADLEFQIGMLEGFDTNSDDKYNTQMICWLKELQRRRAIQSGNSVQVPAGLRLALSNAGIAAPESDDMLFATHEKYVQLLVDWVKERKPFSSPKVPAGYVLVPVEPTPEILDEFDSIIDYGAEDSGDAWRRLLAAAPAVSDGWIPVSEQMPEEKGSSLQLRNLIRQQHAEWSQKTFGNVGPVGPLKHLAKEAIEAADAPDDLSEWADMQFLLWDAQRRAGISDGEITAAMEEKLKVNMAREWPEPKDGEPRQHIQSAPKVTS